MRTYEPTRTEQYPLVSFTFISGMANRFENTPIDPFQETGSTPTNTQPPPPLPTTVPTREDFQFRPALTSEAHSDYGTDVEKPGYYNASAAPAFGIPTGPTAFSPTPSEAPAPTSKFWKLSFYQQFFDVNTKQVLLRISNTLVPLNPPDFLMDRNWHYYAGSGEIQTAGTQQNVFVVENVELSRKPDLFGPFWICTTLWMTLGIVGNIMSKLAYNKAGGGDTPWSYDFQVATVACMVIYLYCFIFGATVWGIMKWKNLPVTLTETICLYGYSMFIFLLTAIFCVIPITWLQWIFVILGGLWSSAYLLVNFWHMWKVTLEPKWFIGIVVVVGLFHLLLTLSFKFYFMNYDY